MMVSPVLPASGATLCQSSSVMKGSMGVCEPQGRLKHTYQRPARTALLRLIAVRELNLGELDIPVAILVPDEAVDGAGEIVEAVLAEALLDFRLGALQGADDPAIP